MNLKNRICKLKNLKKELQRSRQEILKALEADLGKSMEEAYLSEYLMTLEELDYTIAQVPKWARPDKKPTPYYQFPSKGEIHHRPYGRVAIAAPWNYPFLLAMVPTIGALGAGNRVVLKTSRKAPATSQVVRDILGRVYDPEEVLVYGLDPQDRARFMAEDMDFLFFTGSTRVGREMAKLAGEKMIPCVLELGGKSPVIVFGDQDLETTAKRIIWGKTLNAGQTCVAPDYCLVQKDLRDPLIQAMNQAIQDFYGPNPLESSYLASIIDRDHFHRLEDLAKAQGLDMEGKAWLQGLKFAPQVFPADPSSPFMEEEIFGPFLPVLTIDDLEDCQKIINLHPNPLALYLFSQEEKDLDYILDTIPFGGGAFNDTLTHLSTVTLPFGGVGQSGMGAYHGKYSFDTFSRKVSILKKSRKIDLDMRYPPYENFDPRKFFKK